MGGEVQHRLSEGERGGGQKVPEAGAARKSRSAKSKAAQMWKAVEIVNVVLTIL